MHGFIDWAPDSSSTRLCPAAMTCVLELYAYKSTPTEAGTRVLTHDRMTAEGLVAHNCRESCGTRPPHAWPLLSGYAGPLVRQICGGGGGSVCAWADGAKAGTGGANGGGKGGESKPHHHNGSSGANVHAGVCVYVCVRALVFM